MNIPGAKPPVPESTEKPLEGEVITGNESPEPPKPEEGPEKAAPGPSADVSQMTQVTEGLGEAPALDAAGNVKEDSSTHPSKGKPSAPCDWVITPHGDGIQARHRLDNSVYEGSIADFNAMIRG